MGSSAYLTSRFFPLPAPAARFFFRYAGVPMVLGENVHSSASRRAFAAFSASYSALDLESTEPGANPKAPRVRC